MFPTRPKNPSEDLRTYAATAVLPPMKLLSGPGAPPPMPPPGHKSHRNLLHVRQEDWRTLEAVLGMYHNVFCEKIQECEPST